MFSPMNLPTDYRPQLDTREIQAAIKDIKDFFEHHLARALGLQRVTAPIVVRSGTGINDDLNGIERPLRFRLKNGDSSEVEIVQSLAKWKRLALARYGFGFGEGVYADMNAIRPDEEIDNLHSIYVDQWDWEKVIAAEQRNLETLKEAVRAIYQILRQTEYHVASQHPCIRPVLPEEIVFTTSEELHRRYPLLPPRVREDRVCEQHKAVFIIGIGADLADGRPHDGRAPDYDDWSSPRPDGGRGLNGDILLWNPVLRRAFEISSMGIRVDAESLERQLRIRGNEERADLQFHRMLLDGKLPDSIGGGIGQSRLSMFLLRTAHIGEVACGIWPKGMEEACEKAHINLV